MQAKPYFPTGYVQGENKYDFAILELSESLPEYGYFGIDCSPNNYTPKKENLILAGYPGEKQDFPRNVSMW